MNVRLCYYNLNDKFYNNFPRILHRFAIVEFRASREALYSTVSLDNDFVQIKDALDFASALNDNHSACQFRIRDERKEGRDIGVVDIEDYKAT
jgi:hypothetical protein